MALSEKQKQKKLAKKKLKRKTHANALNLNQLLMGKAISYAKYPIHECLIPSNLFEMGIGTVVVSRRTSEGEIVVCAFLIDIFCLGVKNALFKVTTEYEYEQTIKPHLTESNSGIEFEKIHQACARKLIEGAVQYANNLGFKSHSDYQNAKNIFGDIDSSVCPVEYIYGKEGKPYYMRGPNESMNEAKNIINKLSKKCGKGGFDYVVMMDE